MILANNLNRKCTTRHICKCSKGNDTVLTKFIHIKIFQFTLMKSLMYHVYDVYKIIMHNSAGTRRTSKDIE